MHGSSDSTPITICYTSLTVQKERAAPAWSSWQTPILRMLKKYQETQGLKGIRCYAVAEVSWEKVWLVAAHSNNKLIVNSWVLSCQGIVSKYSKAENLSGSLVVMGGIVNCSSATGVTKGWISFPIQPPMETFLILWQSSLQMQLKQMHTSKYTVEKHVFEKPDAGLNEQHKAWLWFPHQWLQIHLFDEGGFASTSGWEGGHSGHNSKSSISFSNASTDSDFFLAGINNIDMFRFDIFYRWIYQSSSSGFLPSFPSQARIFLNVL